MESLIPNNNQELLLSLKQVSRELEEELDGIPPEEAALIPVEGEWSVREVLGHLRDAEQIWNERIRRIMEEDEPFLRGFNPDELAAEHDYKSLDWPQTRQSFKLLRDSNIEVFEKLEPAMWLKGAIHQERGHITLSEMAESLVSHTQTHLEQIRHVRWLAK